MRPLEGIKVLAVENFISMPMATMWLADSGADVVKVEIPGRGDTARSVQPLQEKDGVHRSLSFIRANRNKRSIELDLKDATDRETFEKLVASADIFVENLRPSALPSMGITYEEINKINPGIIYGAISGFGLPEFNDGELPYMPAFDIVTQAMGGLLFRPEGAEEKPVYPGFPLADIFASSNMQTALYQALFHRERTGEGARIDISMLDGVVAFNELSLIMKSAMDLDATPGQHGLSFPFGAYPTADGHVVIAVLGEDIWRRFTIAMERQDLYERPELGSGLQRHAHAEELNGHIQAWLSTKTNKEVAAILKEYGVPTAPVLDMAAVLELDLLHERKMIIDVEDPIWGKITMAGNPLHSTLMEDMPLNPAPHLGADTADVIADWLGDQQ